MNDIDIALFNALSQSQTGADLKDYLKRVQDKICDSRNWQEGETKESANLAARMLEEHVIRKLSGTQAKKAIINESFE